LETNPRFEALNPEGELYLTWPIFSPFRRIALCCILVLALDHPVLQIIALFLLSMITLIILLSNKYFHKERLFKEVAVLLILYLTVCCATAPNNLRQYMGFGLITCLSVIILVFLGKVVRDSLRHALRYHKYDQYRKHLERKQESVFTIFHTPTHTETKTNTAREKRQETKDTYMFTD
jgi:uncharacterized oligopeptide transporter (OPT) family protein